MNKRRFGIIGEKIAQGYLINKGYKILETNFYTKRGEIQMKKLLAGLTLSSALLLAACGSDDAADTPAEGGLQDGTYALEELNFGGTGWKEGLEIVVADGKITIERYPDHI